MRYYLDTSAHLERHGGEEAVRKQAASLLANEEHATSSHVEREWKRIVHGCACDIIAACKGAESLSDVSARLRQGFGRTATQRWLVYDMLIEGDTCTIDELERRAIRALRTTFTAMFESAVEVRDGSQCGIAARIASVDESGKWTFHGSCQKTDSICEQIAFLERNRERVIAAADALITSPRKQDQEMGRKTKQRMGLSEPERKGQACYGSKGIGGDISISLECGNDETLLATDQSFDLICPAIGVANLRLQHTTMPKDP